MWNLCEMNQAKMEPNLVRNGRMEGNLIAICSLMNSKGLRLGYKGCCTRSYLRLFRCIGMTCRSGGRKQDLGLEPYKMITLAIYWA